MEDNERTIRETRFYTKRKVDSWEEDLPTLTKAKGQTVRDDIDNETCPPVAISQASVPELRDHLEARVHVSKSARRKTLWTHVSL